VRSEDSHKENICSSQSDIILGNCGCVSVASFLGMPSPLQICSEMFAEKSVATLQLRGLCSWEQRM
jgi:hypothetical protein